MNHRAIILTVSVLIVVAIVGGVVYMEWPARPVLQGSPAVERVQEQSTATSSLIESLPQPVVGPPAAEAEAGVASASPSIIAVNEPTDVTVTIEITDSRLIPASVNLQRLDASGKVVSVLGTLNDAGTNGDAVAGDKTFTIRQSFTEATTTPVQFRVSWGLKGVLKRVVSNVVSVEVWQRVINQQGGYQLLAPPDWQVKTGTVSLSTFVLLPPGAVSDPDLEYVGDIFVRSYSNPNNLSLMDFYEEPGRVNWFKSSRAQSLFILNGFGAARFEGTLGMQPNTIVTVKLDNQFIEITDFNEGHQIDGVFDNIVKSIVPLP